MQSSRRISIALCCMLLAVRWIPTHARADGDAPAAQTATRPDELPADSPIRRWFTELHDADPRVRDQARFELMGIAVGDLPKLRQLVIESRPLAPAATGALHDIVTHVFLAAETYTAAGGVETDAFGTQGPYFLGVTWPYNQETEAVRLGAIIDTRLPGFPSYRYLRQGDMIMGVLKDPNVPLEEIPNQETHNEAALRAAIGSGAVDKPDLILQVLRDGEMVRITVKMAPKPFDAGQEMSGALPAFVATRAQRANTFWNQNFAPLLDAASAE